MRRRYLVLIVLSILSMITFLDRIALSSASKAIMADLNISTNHWGWILGVFTLAYGAFEIPTGYLGDRIGGKKVLTRVVVWWSVFTILTGFASGFAMLLVVRFLFGIGEAGAYPNTSIVLSKWFPMIERGRAQAMIWGASRVGAALTPFVVIPIQQHYSWHVSFYILGALGLVWALFWIFWHKEEPKDDARVTPDELDEIMSTRSVETHTTQTSFLSGFRSRNLWFLLAMYFCYAIGAYFFQSWFHTYLQAGRNLQTQDVLWASSLPYALAAVGCFAGGWLSDQACLRWGKKWGRRILPMFGLLSSGVLMVTAALVVDNVLAVVALGFGMALMDITAPVAWAVAMDIGGNKSGAVSGAMNTAGLTGAYLSTISFGYLATSFGYHVPVMMIGVLVFCAGIVWFKIDATKKIEFS